MQLHSLKKMKLTSHPNYFTVHNLTLSENLYSQNVHMHTVFYFQLKGFTC